MNKRKSLLTGPILAMSLALAGGMLSGCDEEPPADEPFQSDVPQPETSGTEQGPAEAGGDGTVPSVDSNLQDE